MAEKEKGWIAIHREIQQCWVANDKPYNYMSAWIDLLLLANHKDAKVLLGGTLIPVERGEFITSKRKLSKRWGWSITKVSNFLKLAENDKMLVVKSDTKKTLIKIVNYALYQDIRNKEEIIEETKSNSKVTPKEHSSNTKVTQEENRSNTEVTLKETNNNDNNVNNDRTMINNDNNENNENNIIYSDSDESSKPQPQKEKKESYGENNKVKLTQSEFDRLVNDYGMDKTLKAIQFLDNYIVEKGYKTKSHNLTLRRWVFDAISKNGNKDKITNRVSEVDKWV